MAKTNPEDEQAPPADEAPALVPVAEPERPRRFTVGVIDEQKTTGEK